MVKSTDFRHINIPPRPTWQLWRQTWIDCNTSQYDSILKNSVNDNILITAQLLSIKGRSHVYLKFSGFSIERKLDQAKNFSEAIDIIINCARGEYILILEDQTSARRLFMADPLYSIRLYYRVNSNGDILIDTSVENLLDSSPIEWNLDFLSEFACTQFGPIGETPFSRIKVVPPGHALFIDIDGRQTIERVWHPKAEYNQDAHSVCAEAIRDVYSSITNSYSNLCTTISGGVDSSSGAIFLRKALGPDVALNAVHLYSNSSPEFNERSMASQVADAIGARLICIDVDNCLPFTELITPNPPSCLTQDMLFLGIDRAIAEAIGSSSILLEGQGGDLVFNAVPDARAVLDAWQSRGWSFALHTAQKLALLHNESIPRILLMAVKIAARRRLFNRDASARPETMSRLLRRYIGNASAKFQYSALTNRPSPSQLFLHELDRFVSVMTPVTDQFLTRRINPFLTQSIVEAALNIRSYDSFDSRNDRIVLRRIAHDIQSIDVLRRRTKGTFDVGFIKGLQTNHETFCELANNGVLMRAGRLDEREFTQALKEVRVGQGAAGISLALLGCVEIFCASWEAFHAKRSMAAI